MRKLFYVLLAVLFFPLTALAGKDDDFRSCYDIFGGTVSAKPAQQELFVLIDQTISLDNNLKKIAYDKINKYMGAGKKITIISFSSYQGGRYTKRLVSGQLDFPLTNDERYEISKTQLNKFDTCLFKQENFARKKISSSLVEAMQDSDDNIPNSEIIGNLNRISDGLISKSETSVKKILVISDMLENSKSLSFYKRGNVFLSDPKAAIETIQVSGLKPSFMGANIYILGAGFKSKGYQNATNMKKINTFWKDYFQWGNGVLVGWGQPELFEDID